MRYVQELESYYKLSMALELPDLVPFEKKLRVSGFPYCGLKHAWEKITWYEAPQRDSGMSFYCDVGTAAHLVFQRWLGAKGQIYGDWECRNPNCKHVVHFSNKSKCPKCKREMQYEEFTVKYGKHVSGHLDGVFRSKDGKYFVIDYKTSSVRAIRSQRREPTMPYAKNRAQIQSYCALIEQMYDIEISGWMLLYIARDDPKTVKIVGDEISTKQKASVLKRIRVFDQQYDTVLNLSGMDDIDYLIDTKPCKSIPYYETHMKGFDGCPLEAVCFNSRLPELFRDTLDEYLDSLIEQKPKLVKSKTVKTKQLTDRRSK